MLCTHGFPKSGNHALVKACQLLGVQCDVEHRPHADGLPAGTTRDIFIVRDPRNVVVSMLRWRGLPITPGAFLSVWRHYETASLAEELAGYAPWLTQAGLVVRYESLIAEPVTMRVIAAYLQVPYRPGAWEALPGLTRTWHATPSDYRDVWTAAVQEAWHAEGGTELLDAWGY